MQHKKSIQAATFSKKKATKRRSSEKEDKDV